MRKTEIRVITPITPLNGFVNGNFQQYATGWNTNTTTIEAKKYPTLTPTTGYTEFSTIPAVTDWDWQNGYMMSVAGSTATLSQGVTGVTAGRWYNVRFSVAGYDNSANTGTLNFSLYGNTGITVSTDGMVDHNIYISSTTDTLLKFTPTANFIGGVSNVQISQTTNTTSSIDLYEDDSYNLTFQIQNSISNKSASYSKTIKLPATANNNLIFNNLQDINRYVSDAAFTNSTIFLNKKIPVGIYSDSVELLTGYLEVQNVVNNGNFSEYEVVFYSVLKSLADTIGEKVLRGNNVYNKLGVLTQDNGDLDFSNYNHFHNYADMYPGWSTTSAGYLNGTGIYYPLIDYADINEGNEYRLENFKPALYAKEIWDKIFTKAGYTYTSAFLSGSTFRSLIIPQGNTLEEYSLFVDKTKFMIGRSSDYNTKSLGNGEYGSDCWDIVKYDYTSVSPFFNNSTWNTTSSTWIITSTGIYDFNATVRYNLDITAGASFTLAHPVGPGTNGDWFGVKCRIRRRRNSVTTTVWESDERIHTLTGTTYTPPFYCLTNGLDNYITFYKEKMDCRFGDTFWVEIGLNNHLYKVLPGGNAILGVTAYPKQFLVYSSVTTVPSLLPYTECHNVPTTNNYYLEGSKVFANDILPRGMKQIDFIKSISNRFNLMFAEDRTNPNNLIIEPYDNFYLTGSGNTIDWSSKVDRSKDILFERIPLLIDKDVKFSLKDGQDYLLEKYKENYTENFGDEFVKNPYYSNGSEDVEDNFSSAYMGELGMGTNFITSKIYAENDSSDNPYKLPTDDEYSPRLLFRNMIGASNTTGTTFGIIKVTVPNDDSGTTATGYTSQTRFTLPYNGKFPYAGYLNHPYNPTVDLNYGVAKSYHTGAKLTPNNMFRLYWIKKISMYMDINSRMLTCYVNLNNSDISKLDFRKEIYIDNIKYRLQKIYDWNNNGSCKVELIKVVPFNQSTYVTPQAWQQLVALPGNTAIYDSPGNNIGNSKIKPNVINLQTRRPYWTDSTTNLNNYLNIFPEKTSGIFIGKGNEVSYDNFFVKGDYNTINGTSTTILESSMNTVSSNNVVLIGSNQNYISDGLDGIVLINTSGQTITQSNSSYINNKDFSTLLDVTTANSMYVTYTDQALSKNLYSVYVQTANYAATGFTPSDGDTIYFGCQPYPPAIEYGKNKIYIMKNGTIRMVSITAYAHTVAGSNEAWEMYIRLNDNTDTLIASVSGSTNERHFVNKAIDITVEENDHFEIMMINPTWTTNPTNVTFGGYVYIDID